MSVLIAGLVFGKLSCTDDYDTSRESKIKIQTKLLHGHFGEMLKEFRKFPFDK